MAVFILLDSGPLGQITKSLLRPDTQLAMSRLERLSANGAVIVVPEIADYEVRRELLRMRSEAGVSRLNLIREQFFFERITTAVMDRAAEFWAISRRQGKPTSDPHALDGDVILAAQASLLAGPGDTVVVATTNVGHLNRFVEVRDWATMA